MFSVFGIEAEYMIVSKDTLKVQPIADKVLQELNAGEVCNQVDLGRVSWSNELVNHVLEIKCSKPEPAISDLDLDFHRSIKDIQKMLEKWNACLLPTAMNPWFDPITETVLWPHEQREIYNLYNEIFDCHGHGWSNLQSVHINLPYKNEKEFVQLHTAIRIILPLIPYFAASSPFYDGKKGVYADSRLAFYEKNQAKIPSIIGNIIPEQVGSFAEYRNILKGIYQDIAHYDHTKTLQNPWLNSRAAIPKFDVGAIEIRLMDIQESPYMDFTLINLIVEMVKYAAKHDENEINNIGFSDKYLRNVYDESKKYEANTDLSKYYEFFEISETSTSLEVLRSLLIDKFRSSIPEKFHHGLEVLKSQGSLSQRLIRSDLSIDLYKKIGLCLKENIPYE